MTVVKVLRKSRLRWRMARHLAQAEEDGQSLVVVPGWLAAEVSSYVWRRKVETASDRWAARVDEIPVTEWQAAIAKVGQHRKGKPRER